MSEMRARAQREGAMACAGRAPASSNPRLLSPTTSDRAHHAEHAAGVEEEEEEEERRARPHRAMRARHRLVEAPQRLPAPHPHTRHTMPAHAPRATRAHSQGCALALGGCTTPHAAPHSVCSTARIRGGVQQGSRSAAAAAAASSSSRGGRATQRVLLSSWGEKRAAVGGAAARIARSSVGSSRALSRASAQREFESCCGLKAAATSRARRVRATTTGAVPDTSPILASAHS
eukprot:2247541-Rhodomonas_salina.1